MMNGFKTMPILCEECLDLIDEFMKESTNSSCCTARTLQDSREQERKKIGVGKRRQPPRRCARSEPKNRKHKKKSQQKKNRGDYADHQKRKQKKVKSRATTRVSITAQRAHSSTCTTRMYCFCLQAQCSVRSFIPGRESQTPPRHQTNPWAAP